MGGDFNSGNVFGSQFPSLTDELYTFYNDNPGPDKFDWIVGSKNIRSLGDSNSSGDDSNMERGRSRPS